MMLKDKEIKDKDKEIKKYCKCNYPPPPRIDGSVGYTVDMSEAERDKLIKDYQNQQRQLERE